MAINNTELSFVRPIIDADGTLTLQSRSYFLALNDAINLSIVATGVGSPEGVLEALVTKQYMDTAGTAGAITYVKKLADIAGDKTMGWILT